MPGLFRGRVCGVEKVFPASCFAQYSSTTLPLSFLGKFDSEDTFKAKCWMILTTIACVGSFNI